jgi:hypothetical protein
LYTDPFIRYKRVSSTDATAGREISLLRSREETVQLTRAEARSTPNGVGEAHGFVCNY